MFVKILTIIATHPCMCCHANKCQLLTKHHEARSLQTIQDDFKEVEAAGYTAEAKRQNHTHITRTIL